MNRFLSLAMAFILAFSLCSFTSRADETSDAVAAMQQKEKETQAAISELEKQTKQTKDAIDSLAGAKAQTESNVNALQGQSNSLKTQIKGYSDELEDLSAEISDAESKMADISAKIVALDQELQAARAEEQERYRALKKRIQSFYEGGGIGGMFEVLLEAGSLQEFFTRTEYLSAVVRYDYKMIGEYQTLQQEIEAKVSVEKQQEEELNAYQAILDEKHEELADLTDEVREKLGIVGSTLSTEKQKIQNYDQMLYQLDVQMKALEAQTAAAQARLAQQIAERLALTKEDTSGSYSATDTELEWLAATIQAEADGESYTGKLGVGSVIMNRVKSSAFPNDIISVITQNMQFASYRSGKVELIIQRGPNSTCMQAAQEVLGGARVGDYLFFMTKYYADYYGIVEYTMIGNHAFFYRWVTNKSSQSSEQQTETQEQNSDQQEQKQEEQKTEEPKQEETEEEESEEPVEEKPKEEEEEEAVEETWEPPAPPEEDEEEETEEEPGE